MNVGLALGELETRPSALLSVLLALLHSRIAGQQPGLLEALAQRPGVVKSRNQLLDIAYQDDVYVDDRTIDSHIKRIRRKFRAVDDGFDSIETLYGVGYRFGEE